MNDKFLTTLGLARRAGKLTYGNDMVMAALGATALLLISEDCAPRTQRNAERAAAEHGVPVVSVPFTKERLGSAIGTKPVCLVGVTDKGLTASLAKHIEGGISFGTEIQSS